MKVAQRISPEEFSDNKEAQQKGHRVKNRIDNIFQAKRLLLPVCLSHPWVSPLHVLTSCLPIPPHPRPHLQPPRSPPTHTPPRFLLRENQQGGK